MSLLEPMTILTVRQRLGLTQERMAQVLGVSFVSVNRWENGHSAVGGAVADIYRALESALARGFTAEAILAAAAGERGRFLFELFNMAHGPRRIG